MQIRTKALNGIAPVAQITLDTEAEADCLESICEMALSHSELEPYERDMLEKIRDALGDSDSLDK